jgi:hypothetical protein
MGKMRSIWDSFNQNFKGTVVGDGEHMGGGAADGDHI